MDEWRALAAARAEEADRQALAVRAKFTRLGQHPPSPERDKEIERVVSEGLRMADAARRYDLSRERIRQICAKVRRRRGD